ncbi:MAG: 2Fe-2S iron-sulfur cluster binding domain-containing protein [Verrucomicrobia bacterium]|nr:2Fe-2S iron-sulfur cluster binding domain-containing protein [Verrucomicrobiota bacterium]MBU4290146.1 2Fe-2S iron-sulfur cluster binding domain-containing protein [Verrucomicrobiota bacterium]MBU4429391.1 2Fe-2S iron-sulfur cluster binding domain-containing protein [Verrucomicrobiota bacterium]MCG2681450.1 2Fe-2S iron-sulfur cluster binding domain-containing protein [Kiritimatiellia bacterium]
MIDNQQFTITINERREFRSTPGVSLLTALKGQQVFIPSACGGRGACGLCKVRVVRGPHSPLSSKERFHLTEEEQRQGLRLSCQVPVDQAMAVAIPDGYFHAKEYRAEVADIRNLTHDIRELQLRLIDPPVLAFKAGQYIELQIPRYAQVQRLSFRAYSIASPPSSPDRIELEIRWIPHGLGTTYIFKHLKLHDQVMFHGPHGDFYLRESPRDIILIAGGSGMAPMKSILLDMRERHDPRTTRYFFGARNRRDLFLVDEMKRLELDLPDFKFIPALSQPLPDDSWHGETGLIMDVVDRHIDSNRPADTYLCGSPAMINACLAVLTRKGFSDDRIFFDKYS